MKNILFLFILGLFVACSPQKWVLVDSVAINIPIDSTTDKLASKEMEQFIAPFKENIDKEMSQVIGKSAFTMRAGKPESLLSNWNADVYLRAASKFLQEDIDMAVVNMGSLRAPITKGDITVGSIFQLMPFENELVVLWLKGSEIKKLFSIFAQEGGQGIAGATLKIKDNQIAESAIQGKKIEDDKEYSIATNDFLAGGNDRMLPLATPEKRVDTGLKIRNILMEEVIKTNQKGEEIRANLDGRIQIL